MLNQSINQSNNQLNWINQFDQSINRTIEWSIKFDWCDQSINRTIEWSIKFDWFDQSINRTIKTDKIPRAARSVATRTGFLLMRNAEYECSRRDWLICESNSSTSLPEDAKNLVRSEVRSIVSVKITLGITGTTGERKCQHILINYSLLFYENLFWKNTKNDRSLQLHAEIEPILQPVEQFQETLQFVVLDQVKIAMLVGHCVGTPNPLAVILQSLIKLRIILSNSTSYCGIRNFRSEGRKKKFSKKKNVF